VSTVRPLTTTPTETIAPAGSAERGLVERARAGDQAAFEVLLAARLPSTLRTLTAVLGDPTEARDVAQAVFVQAWRNLPALRDAGAFSPWFSRIIVNAARSSLRRRRRRAVREIPVSAIGDGDLDIRQGDDHEAQAAFADVVGRAFDRLHPDARLILWLHHHEGRTLSEVGERLGISAKTAKSRLFTARRDLQRALEAEDR
jgi:RNA polymerase sigma-70 factor (ECF subfamily)